MVNGIPGGGYNYTAPQFPQLSSNDQFRLTLNQMVAPFGNDITAAQTMLAQQKARQGQAVPGQTGVPQAGVPQTGVSQTGTPPLADPSSPQGPASNVAALNQQIRNYNLQMGRPENQGLLPESAAAPANGAAPQDATGAAPQNADGTPTQSGTPASGTPTNSGELDAFELKPKSTTEDGESVEELEPEEVLNGTTAGNITLDDSKLKNFKISMDGRTGTIDAAASGAENVIQLNAAAKNNKLTIKAGSEDKIILGGQPSDWKMTTAPNGVRTFTNAATNNTITVEGDKNAQVISEYADAKGNPITIDGENKAVVTAADINNPAFFDNKTPEEIAKLDLSGLEDWQKDLVAIKFLRACHDKEGNKLADKLGVDRHDFWSGDKNLQDKNFDDGDMGVMAKMAKRLGNTDLEERLSSWGKDMDGVTEIDGENSWTNDYVNYNEWDKIATLVKEGKTTVDELKK